MSAPGFLEVPETTAEIKDLYDREAAWAPAPDAQYRSLAPAAVRDAVSYGRPIAN
jgi:hypothetical protein